MMRTPLTLVVAILASAPTIAETTPASAADSDTRQSCVQLSDIRSTNVVDSRTIDFIMRGGRTYRNTLRNRCAGLTRQDAFSYRTSLPRLCSVDIIRVLDTAGGAVREGAACALGAFVLHDPDADNVGTGASPDE